MAQPWEQQDRETGAAFAAFQMYRDMPPGERSIRRIADLTSRKFQNVGDWSSKYRWQERVRAWDAEQDRVAREQTLVERKAFARRIAAAGTMMQMKGLSKIRGIVPRVDEDGYTVERQPGQMYIDELSVTDATRLIEIGIRLEAAGRGEPLTMDDSSSTTNVLVINPIVQALTVDPSRASEALAQMRRLAETLGIEG